MIMNLNNILINDINVNKIVNESVELNTLEDLILELIQI